MLEQSSLTDLCCHRLKKLKVHFESVFATLTSHKYFQQRSLRSVSGGCISNTALARIQFALLF